MDHSKPLPRLVSLPSSSPSSYFIVGSFEGFFHDLELFDFSSNSLHPNGHLENFKVIGYFFYFLLSFAKSNSSFTFITSLHHRSQGIVIFLWELHFFLFLLDLHISDLLLVSFLFLSLLLDLSAKVNSIVLLS